MQRKLARPVWGWGPGETPGPTPLFEGSVASRERGANLMTIIDSALRDDLDVHAYREDVLRRALAGETDWGPAMAPHVWKESHPEAVRIYRTEKRRQVADRKQTQRARRRLRK